MQIVLHNLHNYLNFSLSILSLYCYNNLPWNNFDPDPKSHKENCKNVAKIKPYISVCNDKTHTFAP